MERKSIIAPCISQSAQAWITQFYLQIHHALPFLRKRLPAAPTKMFYYLSFFGVCTRETSCFTYCIRWGI